MCSTSATSTWRAWGSSSPRAPCGPSSATVARNRDYRSPIALWESTVRVAPGNPRAHFNLGIVYEAAGRKPEARLQYARALVIEPRYRDAAEQLARSLRR